MDGAYFFRLGGSPSIRRWEIPILKGHPSHRSSIVIMVSIKSLLVAASAFVSVLAAPYDAELVNGTSSELIARGGTPSATGFNNGFYFSWWTDNGAQATYTNGAGGSYSLKWSGNGNLVGGKGWQPGSAR